MSYSKKHRPAAVIEAIERAGKYHLSIDPAPLVQEYSEYNDTDYPKIRFATTNERLAANWATRASSLLQKYKKFMLDKMLEANDTGRNDKSISTWKYRSMDLTTVSGFIYEATELKKK